MQEIEILSHYRLFSVAICDLHTDRDIFTLAWHEEEIVIAIENRKDTLMSLSTLSCQMHHHGWDVASVCNLAGHLPLLSGYGQ